MFKRIKNKFRLISKIGILNFLKYNIAENGNVFSLKLGGEEVSLRKGTPDINVAISCLIDGEFDNIQAYIDRSYKGIIIDAGGYIGTAALAFSNMFPFAQIITIEPSEENIKIMNLNVSNNERIRVVYGALVGTKSDSLMLRSRGTGNWGFTIIEEPGDSYDVEVLQKTVSYTLKDLVENSSDIGVLKLDIEGGELDLFVNDASALENIKVVVAELHDRIVAGCTDAFMEFSKERKIMKGEGEKYVSLRRR